MLVSEYHYTLADAIWRCPLRSALALLPSRRERLGHDQSGITSGDEAYATAKLAETARLRAHYKVLPSIRVSRPQNKQPPLKQPPP